MVESAALRGVVEALVLRVGQALLRAFETLGELDVERKGPVDLVTRVDREAQNLLLEGLAQHFPGERVVAEEGDTGRWQPSEDAWLVDPLDGTTNFVHGLPFFAVSLARVREGRVDLGIVHAPYLRETFWARRGGGAELNARPLHVATRTSLDAALLATGFPYDIRTNPHNNLAQWAHLAVRCRGLRRCGSAALDLAYVAAGRFDGYWEYRLRPWDLAAGALLVEEAGGVVTHPSGRADTLSSGDVVAANPILHAQLCAALRAATRPGG